MIVDHIRNREKYYFLGNDFKAALDYFANVSDTPFDEADINVESSDIVIKLRPMYTKGIDDCNFEAHKNYADIHFVAYGRERIGYNDVKNLCCIDYNEEKDLVSLTGEGDLITLLPGCFMITLPDDAHMPCVCVDKCEPLGKMIAKIKL